MSGIDYYRENHIISWFVILENEIRRFVFKMYCVELIKIIITYMRFMKTLVVNNQEWNILMISNTIEW